MKISRPKVLKSAAGFYIETTCKDEDGTEMPYERLSGYYPTQEAAESELKEYNPW